MKSVRSSLLLLSLALAGCYSPSADLGRGSEAYRLMPPPDGTSALTQYKIGVLDKLSIRTFQEEDLSFKEIQVDAAGYLDFPLVGTIKAIGKTPLELGDEIERGLATRYIVSPQVVIGVVSSAAQKVTVEGNVIEPGVYEISGTTTLLGALARARGMTRVAVVDKVAVFRDIDGQRTGALFDVQEIREGKAPDPEILGGDQIVVGFSAMKGVYRDFIAMAPVFNVFRRF